MKKLQTTHLTNLLVLCFCSTVSVHHLKIYRAEDGREDSETEGRRVWEYGGWRSSWMGAEAFQPFNWANPGLGTELALCWPWNFISGNSFSYLLLGRLSQRRSTAKSKHHTTISPLFYIYSLLIIDTPSLKSS